MIGFISFILLLGGVGDAISNAWDSIKDGAESVGDIFNKIKDKVEDFVRNKILNPIWIPLPRIHPSLKFIIARNILPFIRISSFFKRSIRICTQDGGMFDEEPSTIKYLGMTNTCCDPLKSPAILDDLSDKLDLYKQRTGVPSTPSFVYYDRNLSDEQIQNIKDNPSLLSPENNLIDLNESEFAFEEDNGSFIMLIPPTRRKIVTDEFGNDIEVNPNDNKGVFSETDGFMIMELENSIDDPKTRLQSDRVRMKIPSSNDIHSYEKGTTGSNLERKQKRFIAESYKFFIGNLYSLAQFHTVLNDPDNTANPEVEAVGTEFGHTRFTNKTGLLIDTMHKQPTNLNGFVNYFRIPEATYETIFNGNGDITNIENDTDGDGTNNLYFVDPNQNTNEDDPQDENFNDEDEVSSNVEGTQSQTVDNEIISSKNASFRNRWLNFGLYFYQFMYRTTVNNNINRFKVCGFLVHRSNIIDNQISLGGSITNTKFMLEHSNIPTDFIKVDKDDLIKFMRLQTNKGLKVNNSGFINGVNTDIEDLKINTLNDNVSDNPNSSYKRGYPLGQTNWIATIGATPQELDYNNYYFYKGLLDSNVFEFIKNSNLI